MRAKFRAFIGGEMQQVTGLLWGTVLTDGDLSTVITPISDYIANRVTIMQCTGIKDRNGKELYYSSDLVELPEYEGLFIATKDSFDIPCFSRPDDLKDIIDFKDYFLQFGKVSTDFEIVGNIFDNPELTHSPTK